MNPILLTEEDLLEKFKTFLTQYKITDRVIENIYKNSELSLEQFVKKWLDNQEALISLMCIWSTTKEGHNYWHNLSRQWQSFLNDGYSEVPMILFQPKHEYTYT